MMQFINKFLATGFFIGYIPGAPGTYGSGLSLLLYLLLPQFVMPVSLIIMTTVGIAISWFAEISLSNNDDPRIVIDEIVGMAIALYSIPSGWFFLVLAFILFRIFDIVKPFPINKVQNLPGGLGIMLDDIIAGILANIVILLLTILG